MFIQSNGLLNLKSWQILHYYSYAQVIRFDVLSPPLLIPRPGHGTPWHWLGRDGSGVEHITLTLSLRPHTCGDIVFFFPTPKLIEHLVQCGQEW